jgi:hypothetical protein
MKYLLFSIMLLLVACSSSYRSLKTSAVDPVCFEKIKPQAMTTTWFHASVDVVGKHISGLLLVKPMDDHTQRVVFTSEAGVTFFDFEFGVNGLFTVKKVISQLNKKPVINILRKDFETLLGIPFYGQTIKAWATDSSLYYGVEKGQERYFLVTDKECNGLNRLEVGSKRKPKLTIETTGNDLRAPETVVIHHETFNMVINLKKVIRDAAE